MWRLQLIEVLSLEKRSMGNILEKKGIGFQYVFKAAEAVWTSSREFNFKFIKTSFLGMVIIWEVFPEATPTQASGTSMYLQLSKDYE
jgi:hypothetical protein